jgi:hypothetical protein
MPTINLGRVGIVNKGNYVGGSTQYKVNDICKYNNSVYICIQAHNTEHKPTETDYWSSWIDFNSYNQEVTATDGQTQIALNGPKGAYFSVCINGVRSGSSNWSVSGTTLTFNKALSDSDEVIIDSINY